MSTATTDTDHPHTVIALPRLAPTAFAPSPTGRRGYLVATFPDGTSRELPVSVIRSLRAEHSTTQPKDQA